MKRVKHRIKQYPLEQGALEIQFIEEFFGEFNRKKTVDEIMRRLGERSHIILIAEAPMRQDPSQMVPVSYKVAHEIFPAEKSTKLADLVQRLHGHVTFDGRRVLYSWIGGTRIDWRGQGHFRALTERQEVWAVGEGFHEVVVKTKNKFYEMRSTLARLNFDVIKFERHDSDNRESKVYLSKQLGPDLLKEHKSRGTVTREVWEPSR
ncbi:MAG: hypothetical protein ACRD1X_09650 [Vicinamibacteria bacterium]